MSETIPIVLFESRTKERPARSVEAVRAPSIVKVLAVSDIKLVSPGIPIVFPTSRTKERPARSVEAVRAPATATVLAVKVIRSVSPAIPIVLPTSSVRERAAMSTEHERGIDEVIKEPDTINLCCAFVLIATKSFSKSIWVSVGSLSN